MSRYEVVRMPTDKEELRHTLEEFTPFLGAMYSEDDEKTFGPVNFILDHWLFLWDTGAGFFLTKRNEQGELKALGMLTQYRDIWHARPRLDIIRFAIDGQEDLDAEKEVDSAVDYLISVSSLMKFDLLYYCTRDGRGNESKRLVWSR